MTEVLRLAKGKRGVSAYLGNCDDEDVKFFRLEPPPSLDDLELEDDDITVDNFEAILRGLATVKLRKFDIVVKKFGPRPDKETISLYIEKPLGESFSLRWMAFC